MSLRYSSVVVSAAAAAANNQQPTPTYLRQGRPARHGSDQGQVSTERSRSFQSTPSQNAEREQQQKLSENAELDAWSKLDRLATSINQLFVFASILLRTRRQGGLAADCRDHVCDEGFPTSQRRQRTFFLDELCSASLNRKQINMHKYK